MRILSVHNLYQLRGGEDESRQLEEELLRRNGHIVDTYEEDSCRIPEINPMQLALKTVWSQESYKIVRDKLEKYSYDIMHVQNFFPLISPSIYYAAKSKKVTIVQTLRNFRLLCLNGFLFRDGQICETCLKKAVPWPGIIHRCYRKSLPASITVFSMLAIHRYLGTWNHVVDHYIALTSYDRQKFIEAGIPSERISVKPNFVEPDPGVGKGSGGYILFVGRLSAEKGLDTYLQAAELANSNLSYQNCRGWTSGSNCSGI